MKRPNRYNPTLKYLTHIFCVIIGLTFIASGFAKAIDPWGTAIKFDEYFAIYGLDFLLPLSRVLAVWLCGAELMMGFMILFRVRLRLISIFAMVSMSIFTLVTIFSVSFFPVEDCGCFGDALYLTPWQTLIKNLILLPMVITIWWRYRPDKILIYKPREVILATLFCVTTMSFSAYNYLHLPLIDLLPYKEGAHLLSEIEETAASAEYAVVLVYRNIATGELYEFSMNDTEWHDAEKWEWVDTVTDAPKDKIRSVASDFVLHNSAGEDITIELLSTPGRLDMLAITSVDAIPARCRARIEKYITQSASRNERAVIVTSGDINEGYYTVAGRSIECFNLDPTTLKTFMRARNGVVEFTDGVITSKRSCFDL